MDIVDIARVSDYLVHVSDYLVHGYEYLVHGYEYLVFSAGCLINLSRVILFCQSLRGAARTGGGQCRPGLQTARTGYAARHSGGPTSAGTGSSSSSPYLSILRQYSAG